VVQGARNAFKGATSKQEAWDQPVRGTPSYPLGDPGLDDKPLGFQEEPMPVRPEHQPWHAPESLDPKATSTEPKAPLDFNPEAAEANGPLNSHVRPKRRKTKAVPMPQSQQDGEEGIQDRDGGDLPVL
jgi:hypothetical protein